MVDGQAQAAAGRLVVTRRPRQHQRVDRDLDQAPVMLERLQALHFDVVSLLARSPGVGRGSIVRVPRFTFARRRLWVPLGVELATSAMQRLLSVAAAR